MENGMAIIEMDETGTKAVFIDRDALECDRLNKRTEKRIEEATKKQKENQSIQRKVEKEEEQFKTFTLKTLRDVAICIIIIVLVALGTYAGMIHPDIAFPVMVFSLCIASVKAGIWVGRNRR